MENVKSRSTVPLIEEGAKHGTRKVKIVWHPAYEKHHRTLPKALVDLLKIPKEDELDIVEDGMAFLEIFKKMHEVKSLTWVK